MPQYITVKQAADMLASTGVPVTVATIRRWILNGTLQGKQFAANGQWRVERQSVERMLQSNSD